MLCVSFQKTSEALKDAKYAGIRNSGTVIRAPHPRPSHSLKRLHALGANDVARPRLKAAFDGYKMLGISWNRPGNPC